MQFYSQKRASQKILNFSSITRLDKILLKIKILKFNSLTFKDRVHIFHILPYPVLSYTTNIANFVVLRHRDTIFGHRHH